MRWKLLATLSALSCVSHLAVGQSPVAFAGFYLGLEGGATSYNTQITFDGVDDPAGRGGLGYGVFLGYGQRYGRILVGGEISVNGASVPDPYTFDPTVVGFAELDVRQRNLVGADVSLGYLAINRILLRGSVGISGNRQSVRVDDVPLDTFPGAASAKKYGALKLGLSLEVAVTRKWRFRTALRTLQGHDLDISDFGEAIDSRLTRFDVEPIQQQFIVGMSLGL